jgi:hypothetical protein
LTLNGCGKTVVFNPNHFNNIIHIHESDEEISNSHSEEDEEEEEIVEVERFTSSSGNMNRNDLMDTVNFDENFEEVDRYVIHSQEKEPNLKKNEIPTFLQEEFEFDNESKESSDTESGTFSLSLSLTHSLSPTHTLSQKRKSVRCIRYCLMRNTINDLQHYFSFFLMI